MWGDYELLQFYPSNWQVGYFNSGHLLLIYIIIWQYWLWFTFIFLINIYFIFLFRIFSYNSADVRGRSATGDKRNSAWPELFTCFFPFLWSLNILNNSLNIIKSIEVTGGYTLLTLQVIGFQWGWRYGYGELNYVNLLLNPINVGLDSVISPGNSDEIEGETSILAETYFCRSWINNVGNYPNYMQEWINVPVYQPGLWFTAQGENASVQIINTYTDRSMEVVTDMLRLYRTTNAVVIPTRSVIRILSTAEDVTHSWAVPALGIKLDCVPGRLFVSFINIVREGVYYGQCSELCGWNHYNMPIIMYAIPLEHFIVWWEMELHLIFSKLISDNNNYSLLNVKYN